MTDAIQPKRKAKDNPWYRLATLHGVPTDSFDEIAVKNRVTWNQWMAPIVSDELRNKLLETKRYSAEELEPLSDDERRAIETQFGDELSSISIDFSETEFDTNFAANGFIFPEISFIGATFFGNANFRNATFAGDADFRNATFTGGAYFGHTIFTGDAKFDSATFTGGTFFDSATFNDDAYFDSATFIGDAEFNNATFTGYDNSFYKVTFIGDAYFVSATFTGGVDFDEATFTIHAQFTNAEMKHVTSFNKVTFAMPPACFNAKLHEGTTWYDVRWPEVPKDINQARIFVDSYQRLTMEMDRLKKYRDELDFFALELRCRRKVEGFWPGLSTCIYGWLSDYGRSYFRPLLFLVATVLFGAVFPMTHFTGFRTPTIADWDQMKQAIGISFANTLGVFGRPLMKPQVLWDLPDWLKAVGTAQTVLGFVLLFLFGLGIRNAFRMK